MPPAPLFLSEADVAALAFAFRDATSIVERALVDIAPPHAGGRTILKGGQPDASFQASTGVASEQRVAGVKWISVAGDAARERARVSGLVVVNDYASGALSGIVDAGTIVALRTAAESIIAARYLARADCRHIGFVACGRQALAHLEALASAFPLTSVHAYSPSGRGAERIAQAAHARGLEARVVDDPRDAVERMDMIVSSVPFMPDAKALADSRWVPAGAFVAFLDFARRWTLAEPFDVVAVDDGDLLRELAANARATIPGGRRVDLGALVAGTAIGRTSATQRASFVQCGVAAGDLALANVALQRARAQGIGTPLGRG